MSDRLKISHVAKRLLSVSQKIVCDALLIRVASLVIEKSGAVWLALGVHNLRQQLAAIECFTAIAIAGGATYRASTSEVDIQRAGTFNLQKFPQSPTIAIMPGDLVRVPETIF